MDSIDTFKKVIDKPTPEKTPFLTKLNTLNKKIELFQQSFNGRKPRQMNWGGVLKDKNISFDMFKLLYGSNSTEEFRTVKIGEQYF